jgi:hypothetical protein
MTPVTLSKTGHTVYVNSIAGPKIVKQIKVITKGDELKRYFSYQTGSFTVINGVEAQVTYGT